MAARLVIIPLSKIRPFVGGSALSLYDPARQELETLAGVQPFVDTSTRHRAVTLLPSPSQPETAGQPPSPDPGTACAAARKPILEWVPARPRVHAALPAPCAPRRIPPASGTTVCSPIATERQCSRAAVSSWMCRPPRSRWSAARTTQSGAVQAESRPPGCGGPMRVIERFEGPNSRRYPARKPDGW